MWRRIGSASCSAQSHPESHDVSTSAYGKTVPPIRLGERMFEIAVARRVASGDTTTTWFGRHGSTPITEIPAHWPDDYRDLVPKRLDAIESVQNIRLIEQYGYKRW